MKILGDLLGVLIIPLACMLLAAFVAVVLAMPNGIVELLG